MTDLWPHQQHGLTALRHEMKNGASRPVLCIPTGGGKTKLAAAIIRSALAKGNRVVFTVPSVTLVDQTVAEFGAEGILDIGVIQADHPLTNPKAMVQVASVQTLARRKLPETDMVIVDECHQQFSIIAKWMRSCPELRFVGLSATPWATGMGKHYDRLVIATTVDRRRRADALPGLRADAS